MTNSMRRVRISNLPKLRSLHPTSLSVGGRVCVASRGNLSSRVICCLDSGFLLIRSASGGPSLTHSCCRAVLRDDLLVKVTRTYHGRENPGGVPVDLRLLVADIHGLCLQPVKLLPWGRRGSIVHLVGWVDGSRLPVSCFCLLGSACTVPLAGFLSSVFPCEVFPPPHQLWARRGNRPHPPAFHRARSLRRLPYVRAMSFVYASFFVTDVYILGRGHPIV